MLQTFKEQCTECNCSVETVTNSLANGGGPYTIESTIEKANGSIEMGRRINSFIDNKSIPLINIQRNKETKIQARHARRSCCPLFETINSLCLVFLITLSILLLFLIHFGLLERHKALKAFFYTKYILSKCLLFY